MKRFQKAAYVILGMVIMALLSTMVFPAMAATIQKTITVYSGYNIYVDDVKFNPVDSKGNPLEAINYNGTTYLPVRAVAEAVGTPISWDGNTSSVYIGKHTSVTPAPTPAPASANIISDMVVKDTESAAENWSIQSGVKVDDLMFGDRDYKFTDVAASVAGCDWIRPAADSKYFIGDTLVTFKVSKDCDVYIASDDRITTKPTWMSGWTATSDKVACTSANPVQNYTLYKKSFTAGSTVTLGDNSAGLFDVPQYMIFVKAK